MEMARLVSLLTLVLAASPALAGPTAEEIADKATDSNMFGAQNGKTTIELVLFREGSLYRTRQVTATMKKVDKKLDSLIVFDSPAEMAGTKLLSVEETDGDAQQFLYLPAFKKVKRIVGAEKSKAFMQTDFTYKDLEGNETADWTWKFLPDADYKGSPCYVIEGLPKKKDQEDYGKMVMWVDKKHLVNVKSEFYDKDAAKVTKQFWVEKLEKKDDRWTAMDSFMESPLEKTKTQLKVKAVDYKTVIPPTVFDRAALER